MAFLLALSAVHPAYAAVTGDVGWVLVDNTNFTGTYTADAQHSFSSTHGTVSVFRGGPGVYAVNFSNLFIQSGIVTVLATPYNSPNQCVVGEASGSATTPAGGGLTCYDRFGNPADTPFSLLFETRKGTFGSAADALAFVEQTTNTATTNVSSYNSTGGTNSAVKSSKTGIGPGNYTVTLPGLTEAGGDIQAASYNGASYPSLCKVVDWSAASMGTTATVQCYRIGSGIPIYSPFNFVYAIGEPFGLVPGEATLGAWVWAHDPTPAAPYRPNMRYQYNGFRTGAITVARTSVGHYTVTIPGTLTYTNAVALVTAWGADTDYCNVAGWTGGTINVVCYTQSRAFADSRFDLTFQTAR